MASSGAHGGIESDQESLWIVRRAEPSRKHAQGTRRLDASTSSEANDSIPGVRVREMRRSESLATEETPTKDVDLSALEEAKRMEWNQARFEDLGFQSELAELLAEARVDWHRAEEMLDRGCSQNHVLKILL